MLSLTPEMRSVLLEGRQAHVAVTAKDGPHVTPELYAVAGDTLWFLVAATTLKARVIPKNDRIAALVRSAGRAVVLSGDAATYDVRSPHDVLSAVKDPNVAKALSGFLLRNAGDLAAFAKDTLSGRLGRKLPPRRVLVRLRPTRAALLDGAAVTTALGDWPGPQPTDSAEPLAGSKDGVVGWQAPDGPLALPARLTAGDVATVPCALATLAALPSAGPACVVTDDYGRPGPAAKTGTLHRGTGSLAADGRVTFEVSRTTTWDGVKTSTTSR
ncbi:MAG TPA: pyridoxamine 5'-phosphate oxidase family protein [Mycobacteriales bacterium]|jgi:hypothetical protein|nr:pyridoxamine 5'-phosphate oxidase family protein [Mycobacteriales bacterium]